MSQLYLTIHWRIKTTRQRTVLVTPWHSGSWLLQTCRHEQSRTESTSLRRDAEVRLLHAYALCCYMYVCMYVDVDAAAHSLDCHGWSIIAGSTKHFSRAQNWVSDNDESQTVSGSEFHIAGPEYEKLRCP